MQDTRRNKMKNLAEIDDLTNDTRRYEFLDGLVDITYGILFMVLGLANWFFFSRIGLQWYLKALIRNREITLLGSVLVFGSLLLLVFGSQRIIRRIRMSEYWGSKGYMKPLRWQVRWPIQLIAVVVSIAIIITSFVLMLRGKLTQGDVLRFLVFSIGIGTGIMFLGIGIDLKVQRYVTVGIVGIVSSIIIAILGISFSTSWFIFGISWMVLLALSGIWAIRQYQTTLRRFSDE
jgi:hypothetical protein